MQSKCRGDVCEKGLMLWLYPTAKSHQISLNTLFHSSPSVTYFFSHLSLIPSGRRSSVTGVHALVEILALKMLKQQPLQQFLLPSDQKKRIQFVPGRPIGSNVQRPSFTFVIWYLRTLLKVQDMKYQEQRAPSRKSSLAVTAVDVKIKHTTVKSESKRISTGETRKCPYREGRLGMLIDQALELKTANEISFWHIESLNIRFHLLSMHERMYCFLFPQDIFEPPSLILVTGCPLLTQSIGPL